MRATILIPAALALGLGACQKTDHSVDRGIDSKHLSQLQAGIWVDPDGCDNWIIDDGAEGYMMRRRDPKTGLPVCSGVAPPGMTAGDFKGGSPIPDPI